MKVTAGDIYFVASLLLALWFIPAGITWAYWAALVIGYPAALLSLGLWALGRRTDEKKARYRYILWILGLGLVLSLSMLAYLLVFD